MPRRFLSRVLGPCLLAVCLTGCAAGTGEDSAYTTAESQRAPGPERVSHHFDADIDTVQRVMGWTLGDMHWGQARIVNEVTALNAVAVTDTDHVVDIRVQKAAKGGVDVQVKIGYFGDKAMETEFLRVLGGRITKWQREHPGGEALTMRAAILSIGDELVLGQTVDTNSAWLSARLLEYGIMPAYHLTVPDDRAAITEAFRDAAARCPLVIVSGGLGPTEDDLTRQGLADAMGVGLVLHEPSLEHVRGFFTRRKREMPEANAVQAMFPVGAAPLDNPIGTAPGIRARMGTADIFVMPGVPKEMFRMYEGHVLPFVQTLSGEPRCILTAKVNTFGAGESDVGTKLGTLMDRKRNPTVGTTVAEGLVSVRVRSEYPSRDEAQRHLDDTLRQVETVLAPLAFGRDDQRLQDALLKLLLEHKKTVTTAESCTAGLLGKCITDPAGSSAVYVGGWVTYTNAMKQRDLGVPPEVFERHGAVSRECVTAMADGALHRSGADYALAITGIAGPGGGTPDKPVGTVWVGLADRSKPTIAMKFLFPGDREMVRDRSAKTAMNMLRLRLMKLD